jgi:hypothetical protein
VDPRARELDSELDRRVEHEYGCVLGSRTPLQLGIPKGLFSMR